MRTIKNAFKYLFDANKEYRKYKFEKLKEIPLEVVRKRSSEAGWSIEELIRHMVRTEEWWMHSIILQTPNPKYHIYGIANDQQATNWVDLDALWDTWNIIEEMVYEYLESNPNLSKLISHGNSEWNEKFSGRWVLYHLLQHELETWGMIAERLRQWKQNYWEF